MCVGGGGGLQAVKIGISVKTCAECFHALPLESLLTYILAASWSHSDRPCVVTTLAGRVL